MAAKNLKLASNKIRKESPPSCAEPNASLSAIPPHNRQSNSRTSTGARRPSEMGHPDGRNPKQLAIQPSVIASNAGPA